MFEEVLLKNKEAHHPNAFAFGSGNNHCSQWCLQQILHIALIQVSTIEDVSIEVNVVEKSYAHYTTWSGLEQYHS